MTDGGRIEDIEATRDTAEVMIDIMTVAEDTDTEVEVMREIVITETDTEIDMRVDTAEIEIGIEEVETGMRGDMEGRLQLSSQYANVESHPREERCSV